MGIQVFFSSDSLCVQHDIIKFVIHMANARLNTTSPEIAPSEETLGILSVFVEMSRLRYYLDDWQFVPVSPAGVMGTTSPTNTS